VPAFNAVNLNKYKVPSFNIHSSRSSPESPESSPAETVPIAGENYKTVGFCDDVMALGEISVQALERTS